jgi:hypothetical protein
VDGELDIGSHDGEDADAWHAIRSDGTSARPTRLPRSARRDDAPESQRGRCSRSRPVNAWAPGGSNPQPVD